MALFPYVLMKPLTLIALIAGGMKRFMGVCNLLDGGCRAKSGQFFTATPKRFFPCYDCWRNGGNGGDLYYSTAFILKMEKKVAKPAAKILFSDSLKR